MNQNGQQQYCPECGRACARDLGCSRCSHILSSIRGIERLHPGSGLAHHNLVKLAGHFAAGLHEAFVYAHGRAGFDPTIEEFSKALEWGVEQFRGTKYVLRKRPNGSMTDGPTGPEGEKNGTSI